MNHVRVIDVMGGRRPGNGYYARYVEGKSHTLCGGEMTDRDQSVRDARREYQAGLGWKWLECGKCRAMIEGRTAEERARP